MEPRAAGLGVGGDHGSPGRPGSLAAARTPVSADTALFVLAVGGWLCLFPEDRSLRKVEVALPFHCERKSGTAGCFLWWPSPSKTHCVGHTCFPCVQKQHSKATDSASYGVGLGVIRAQTHQPQSPEESIQVMLATFLTAETKHPEKIKLEEGRFTHSGLQFERMWPIMTKAG